MPLISKGVYGEEDTIHNLCSINIH